MMMMIMMMMKKVNIKMECEEDCDGGLTSMSTPSYLER